MIYFKCFIVVIKVEFIEFIVYKTYLIIFLYLASY